MPHLKSAKSTEGDWFTWFESTINEKGEPVYADPAPGEKGRIRARSIAAFIQTRAAQRKKKHEFVLNPATRSMERVAYYEDLTPDDIKKEQEDLWDYAITGIEKFVLDGEEIPCTREGKVKLMALPVFDRFIGQCLRLIANVSAQEKEQERKNSESTQDES